MKKSLNRTRADPIGLTAVGMTAGGYVVYLAARMLLARPFAMEAPLSGDPVWWPLMSGALMGTLWLLGLNGIGILAVPPVARWAHRTVRTGADRRRK